MELGVSQPLLHSSSVQVKWNMSHGYSESLEILIAQIGRRTRGLTEIKLLVQAQA